MADQYDDPSDPELRTKFYREGIVIFSLPRRQFLVFKSAAQDLIKLDMIKRRDGWKNKVHLKYLVISGIVKSVFLTFCSPKAADLFEFFAINKSAIRNIDEKPGNEELFILTFYKKKET